MDIAGLRFRKLKLKDGTVRVDAEHVNDFESYHRSVSLKTKEEPLPSFNIAVEAVRKAAMEMILAPDDWSSTRLSGMSINYEGDDRFGVVVTLLVDIDGFAAPLVINTPHLRQELPDDEGGIFMPEDFQADVEVLRDEAMKFLAGERAQANLFSEPARERELEDA